MKRCGNSDGSVGGGPALLVSLLLALCPAAWATDFYVDAASGGGDGSAGNPFKTIQQGLNAAQAGDTVIVRGETYTQTSSLSFPRSGAAGQPITLKAAPGQTVLVQASGNIHLIQTARSYITVEGIIFDGNYSAANGLIRLDPGGTFQTFRRCEFRRQGNHLFRIDSSDLLLEDCHLHHAIVLNNPLADAHCLHSQTGFRHTFLRCDVHHATGDLWQGSRDGAWGDIVFDGCDLHIELADGDCNGIAEGTPITENHLDTKNAVGVVNYNVTLRNNVIRGSRKGRLGINSAALNLKDGVSGFFIYNNRLYDNAWAFRLRHPSTDYHVYNNFVYDNDLAVRLEDGVSSLAFANNTFYDNTALIQNVSSAAPLTWTNNVFATSNGTVWPGTYAYDLFWNVPGGSWQSVNGNRVADPLFVNAEIYDLHLAAGSPAINAGLTVAEVTTDIDGEPRPMGAAYEIGADEFTWAGDITKDGRVNVFDLQRLAGSWNKQAGQVGYDPACDLTGDKRVNVFDLQVLAGNWNRQ